MKSVSIRLDDELQHKLRYVSAAEARSINSQVRTIIRRYIEAFEKKHGPIP